MEPKLPSPERGIDFRSALPAPNGELSHFPPSPEQYLGQSTSERLQQQGEAAPAPLVERSTSPVVTLPTPIPLSDPSTNDDTSTLPSVQDDDTPAVAKDTELIEKEWVNKAKKVITETKDDPYRREQEVNKLQADYLLKRYGRTLGSPQQ